MSEGIERRAYRHRVGGRVLTKQSEASEADINNIMARYVAHGTLPVRTDKPLYGDFSNVSDYRSAVQRVMDAEADFAALPASVRDRCGNDLGNFVGLVATPEGLEELMKLGLDPERVPVSAVAEEPASPPPEAPAEP